MLRPLPERGWGRATELAEQYDISRTLLYHLRDQAQGALTQAFLPQPPGPGPEAATVLLDRDFIRRAVTVLALVKGSVRDIQLGLALLFGLSRSVGYISETLQEVGGGRD
jgi:transposase-like protein